MTITIEDAMIPQLILVQEAKEEGIEVTKTEVNEFVDADKQWAHFDVMAWNTRERPGRPKGGEAMGLLVAFKFLQQRYG